MKDLQCFSLLFRFSSLRFLVSRFSYIFVMSCLKVICWALIFIFKLRFPPGVSIATVLKYSFVTEIIQHVANIR
jgi:hypothetical protein